MIEHLFNVYNRAPLAPVTGRGAWVTADDGREYFDCVGGVAVNALGHCHPALVAALTEQAGKLWHVSNIFRVPGQEALAARLCATSFADRVFFSNTGAEAVECAIKTARRFHATHGAPERVDVIAAARDHGLLIAGGGDNVVRLLPPLTLTDADAREVLLRLDRTFAATAAPALAA